MADFTHFDSSGNAVMVPVGDKPETRRKATARGRIHMSAECFEKVRQGSVAKGDVLGVARVSGIMATKQTSSLIPLCHPIRIDHVSLDFELSEPDHAIEATCTVGCSGATGVEMEALTGVSIALLTVYDMCKAVDKEMELGDIYLLEKTGGKSGSHRNSKRG